MSVVFIGPTPRCLLGVTTRLHGSIPCFFKVSGEINEFMKMHFVNLAELGLRQVSRRLYDAGLPSMALAYKKDVNDSQKSPAIKIIEELANLGTDMRIFDPFVPSDEGRIFTSMRTLSIIPRALDR